ncbi:MAG: hypothetical protein FJ404_17890 [Verrucomicrobia bacterium]|nr:hypothetical protein [Verrucomicrobiota bacterium]
MFGLHEIRRLLHQPTGLPIRIHPPRHGGILPGFQSSIFCLAGVVLLGIGSTSALAQGCVATRGAGLCSIHGASHSSIPDHGDWEATLGYRWLHSDRHFVGDREQPQRQDLGTEVINDSHFFDLSLRY